MSREIARRVEASAQGKKVDTMRNERKVLTRKNLYALPLALGLPLTVGLAGAIATSRSLATWYRDLKKPAWNPPNSIFGPVWTTLYLMMGLASWLVWTRRDQDEAAAGSALTSTDRCGRTTMVSSPPEARSMPPGSSSSRLARQIR